MVANVPPTMSRRADFPPQIGTEVPAGTELDVCLLTIIDSATARSQDRFDAATMTDVRVNEHVVVPAGSHVRGVVTAVTHATPDRSGSLTVAFDYLTVDYRAHPVRAQPVPGATLTATNGDLNRLPGAIVRVRLTAPVTILRFEH